jgi:hypothetical protein
MMAQGEHVIHNGTAWDEERLTQLPDNRIRIVMMDCGNGMKGLTKSEYSTVDQFQEISDILGEHTVCKLVTHHEWTNSSDFRRNLKDAIVKDMPTIIQINAVTHTDDGILTKGTWWQTNCMTANIEVAIREHKHSIKSIILNMPKASQVAYEMKTTDPIPVYCLDADAYPPVAISQQEITNKLSRFYMMTSCNPDNIAQHMQQSDLSTNVQTLYDLVMHFNEETPRDDEPDSYYREGMEVIKQECKSIVDILEQDSA